MKYKTTRIRGDLHLVDDSGGWYDSRQEALDVEIIKLRREAPVIDDIPGNDLLRDAQALRRLREAEGLRHAVDQWGS